jgi:dolichol kinase
MVERVMGGLMLLNGLRFIAMLAVLAVVLLAIGDTTARVIGVAILVTMTFPMLRRIAKRG